MSRNPYTEDMSALVARKPPAETEAQFQNRVIQLAKLRGWRHYHTYDSRRSAAGFPDLVLVHPTHKRVLYRELKTATGRLSKYQQEWLHLLKVAGADADVWRPADWDLIQATLRGEQ